MAVAVNPVTNKIYVASFYRDNVTVIDGATNDTVLVPTGDYPIAVAVNPVTNRIYVANENSNNVTVIDGATNDTTSVPAAGQPVGVAVNPATNRIYVASRSSNTVTVIDGATNDTALVPLRYASTGVAVNPVTNKIYVTNQEDQVAIIDGATNDTTSVPAGDSPWAVAVNPVTNRIYVPNYSSNNVTVIDEVPESDTRVWSVVDALPGDTTVSARPSLTGRGVNRWPLAATRIEGVLTGLNSAQRSWNWAQVTGGAGTDSVSWEYNWGTDSLILGENFVLCLALESDASIMNNLGLGTPFAGNLEVYPVYRMESPGGAEERTSAERRMANGPTIVRGVLFLPRDMTELPGNSDRVPRPVLLDISGRKVMDLAPGANDVRALAPGVYFCTLDDGTRRSIRKVVLTE
jgi:YVTN family beta-propeller protein